MPDIIRLLPDSVANQIAAGEVIQRPASAVKELMENAIDAGATHIKLIIKDAGKTLIQVIDNGCGMSETDARLSFERHATSKIQEAGDLFNIRTMGFRGEALASIASIAHVELKTKRTDDETGTCILIEGSEVKSQESCQCAEGTSISVKNLFFNVPARRNFLKNTSVETKHILDEFHRIALAFPDVSFEMYHNNNEVYHLQSSPIKQRIVNLFGNNFNQRLLPVELDSSICKVSGFIGKPESAKKTRGEQFFFTNKRYIKHPYLNHAVLSAYVELIPNNSFPSYFLFIEINTKDIDINIHPTKTEIKFQDDRSIYAMMKSAVKQSLGKFSATPSIDFTLEKSFDIPPLKKGEIVKQPTVRINPNYNPFDKKLHEQRDPIDLPISAIDKSNKENWEILYSRHADNQLELPVTRQNQEMPQLTLTEMEETSSTIQFWQLHNCFILKQVKSGIMIVDQQLAHERILFEDFSEHLSGKKTQTNQQLLFPQVVEFSAADAVLIKEIKDELRKLGFDIDEFGSNSYVLNGIPADLPESNIKQVLDGLLENFKTGKNIDRNERQTAMAKALAKNMAIKHGKILKVEEMCDIIDRLFACEMPNISIDGKATIFIMTLDELEKKFK